MRRAEAGHLLRTPLTVIKARLQLALRRWDDLTPGELKEQVREALTQVDRLESLIADAEQRIFHNERITVRLDDGTEQVVRAHEGTDVYETPHL